MNQHKAADTEEREEREEREELLGGRWQGEAERKDKRDGLIYHPSWLLFVLLLFGALGRSKSFGSRFTQLFLCCFLCLLLLQPR